MFFKTIKYIQLSIRNFPKIHFYLILLGFIILVGMSFLSNLELNSASKPESLLTEIPIDQLIKIEEENTQANLSIKKEATIKRNDSLFSILNRLGIEQKNIFQIINSENSNLLTRIKIGKRIKTEINESNEIISLNYINDFKSGVRVRKEDKSYVIEEYILQTEKFKVFKNIIINTSLYVDGLKQGLPDSVIMDLVYIFGWDIDFVHDIRPGDSYSLIYEEIYVNGEKKLNGDILIAEFLTSKKEFIAIRYKLKNGISEYFSLEGRNVKKASLRSPVKFSYISDKYNLRRKHPIYNQIRAHTGVDYAAVKGTPVRATGDGTVVYASVKGGYGNLVEIKHTENYSTRYAHLDSFYPRIRVGKKVKQSDRIGYVGGTGTVTGDHLHYEFRVNGKHTNPLTVKFPNAKPINLSEQEDFSDHSMRIFEELKNYQNLNL